MSFKAAVISGGDDETTLAKSLIMAVKGPAQQWYCSLKAKSIHSWDQLKANLLVDFHGFQLQAVNQRAPELIFQKIHPNQGTNSKYPR